MSSKKRQKVPVPAMHLAWSSMVLALESEVRTLKGRLGRRRTLKEARVYQRRQATLRSVLTVLYALRRDSKAISFQRWQDRHALYPERPPICGKPSIHPDICGCPKPESNM